MSDEKFLINVAKPGAGKVRRFFKNNAIAVVALLVSITFSVLQRYEACQTRKLVLLSQSPYLEVRKAEFASESSLFITVHNIGHAPALSLKSTNDVYVGSPGILRSEYSRVPQNTTYYGRSVPVNEESQMASYLVPEKYIQEIASAKKYGVPTLEIRGQIAYRDSYAHAYYLPYCYVVHKGQPLPIAQECNDAFDDLLRQIYHVDK